MSKANKAVVRRLVTQVLNGGHLEVIDELYGPELAPAARRWIAPFRTSFPDVDMEIVELSPSTLSRLQQLGLADEPRGPHSLAG